MTNAKQTSVLIVGAGPTGLVLALWLKKRGIDFRIIDKNSAPGQTSRALAVQARTLEFYRQLGIADQLIEAGVLVPEIIIRRTGRIVARAKIGALGKNVSPFPYVLFCSQDIHESLLVDLLKKEGVEIERQTELIEFRQDAKQVIAKIQSPRGKETILADYICGCDGAHSVVRHGMPTDFPGGSYNQVFFVADVLAKGDAAAGGVQISVSKKDFCIVMPIKSLGSVRLTGIVPPQCENKEAISFDDVGESVTRNTGLKVSQINWFSTYNVHHRVADRFRKGRAFIAGDAGHIHSPAGGQGMNTGIGDAVNLAWKLADVIQGRGSDKLLDTYEFERHAFARVLIRSTDQAFKVIASQGWIGSIFRAYLLPTLFAFLTRLDVALKFMFRTISQIRIQYRSSFLSQGVAGKISAGDRLPWVKTSTGDNFETLRSLDWQIHVYGKVQKEFAAAAMVPVHGFDWNERVAKAGFARNAAYLLRPDGHVGLAVGQDIEVVRQYFEKIRDQAGTQRDE